MILGPTVFRCVRMFLATCLLWPIAAHAYFNIINPHKNSQWVNGETNLISWSKGLRDDILDFDIELMRLTQDGFIYVARGIDAHLSGKAINLFIQDVPTGDDYFLIFLNTTHGVTYTTSDRFTILASGSSPSGEQPKPSPSAPVVSISGGPNPTAQFATTFPAVSGALKVFSGPSLGMIGATLLALFAGAWSVFL